MRAALPVIAGLVAFLSRSLREFRIAWRSRAFAIEFAGWAADGSLVRFCRSSRFCGCPRPRLLSGTPRMPNPSQSSRDVAGFSKGEIRIDQPHGIIRAGVNRASELEAPQAA